MYEKAKSFIKKATLWSHYFSCNVGVKQGDNLSRYYLHCLPTIFALYQPIV